MKNANDTLLLGREVCEENLSGMKALLRWIEQVSRL